MPSQQESHLILLMLFETKDRLLSFFHTNKESSTERNNIIACDGCMDMVAVL